MTEHEIIVTETQAGFEVSCPALNLRAIDVYAPHAAYGGLAPATVNWSGIGSVDVEVALAYSAMIERAAMLANEMNLAAGS